MIRGIYFFVAFAMTCCPAGAAAPADWPRWRGHEGAGQGGEVALPGDWDAIAWKWKAALPGEGHSSPVVFRGGVYAASADEALTPAGEPLWHADRSVANVNRSRGASVSLAVAPHVANRDGRSTYGPWHAWHSRRRGAFATLRGYEPS